MRIVNKTFVGPIQLVENKTNKYRKRCGLADWQHLFTGKKVHLREIIIRTGTGVYLKWTGSTAADDKDFVMETNIEMIKT